MVYIIEENIDRLGGVERIVSTLANYFANTHNIEVISIFSKDNGSFFNYNNKVKRVYLSNPKYYKMKFPNKIKYLLLLPKIIRICRKTQNNDTIIFGRVSIAVKFLPFIKNNPKIIVRDAINIYSHSSYVKKIMKFYFPKKVSTFIVSSNESLDIYKDFFGVSKVNMLKMYNPLTISLNNNLKYNYGNKTILLVGRFDIQKGFENVIEAFSFVCRKHPDWKLKIVGEGELLNAYKNIICDLALEDNVIIMNSSKSIEEEYLKSSIFIMSSRYEGYANALVEALALGIPSISFDWLTGVDDIIEDNVNGIIVKLTDRFSYYNGVNNQIDVQNLANAIYYLIENREVTEKISKNALKIRKSRDSNKILEQWEKIIDENTIKND